MLRRMMVLCTALLLLCAMPISCAHAQAGWFFAGYLLGTSNDTPNIQSGINPDLIYQAPNLAQRVVDPLAVKQASKAWDFSSATDYNGGAGKSIRELFALTVKDTAGLELLQVRRVISGNNADYSNMWFVYTTRANLVPGWILQPPPPDTTAAVCK